MHDKSDPFRTSIKVGHFELGVKPASTDAVICATLGTWLRPSKDCPPSQCSLRSVGLVYAVSEGLEVVELDPDLSRAEPICRQ